MSLYTITWYLSKGKLQVVPHFVKNYVTLLSMYLLVVAQLRLIDIFSTEMQEEILGIFF